MLTFFSSFNDLFTLVTQYFDYLTFAVLGDTNTYLLWSISVIYRIQFVASMINGLQLDKEREKSQISTVDLTIN